MYEFIDLKQLSIYLYSSLGVFVVFFGIFKSVIGAIDVLRSGK